MCIKAFIFDLDGVITDTAEYHFLAWEKTAKILDIPFDRAFNENLKGVSRMESLEKILVNGNKQNDLTYEEKLKLAYDKNQYYVELIEQITEKDLLPGIEDLLKELKQKKIKIGLASASKNAITVIQGLKVGKYFDFIADAAICKNSKPAPDIFLMAAEGLGLEAKYCVGVEDAEAGIEAIKAAKMFSVGVGEPISMRKADMIVANTKELSLKKIIENYKLG
ncbi:beta-phosphoglucomutase [Clostridium grantii]|uniref:Beta-phosphoglucomutase n=1 Tax=Clostridium grantii DSM 8605 TaxID=1121316 RepID=A0A1M5TH21_9CLOT|nr:beta-phosphoglucomutase [Clostridium grantii]SHH50047.1 beta-phosphoglucomutase [Clostridium grantii DSM 8605]